jgi:predicted enzyme related to lactoylglutathione lyase
MKNNHIDYIEFRAKDLEAVKAFYQKCFQWEFTDYGPEYCSFEKSGVAGGFQKSDESPCDGVLVVLYHSELETVLQSIREAGGKITKEIFAFPGGRRFHFRDPGGNQLAVWSEP